MTGGDSDGVHTGVAVNVLNNEFRDLCDKGGNHTDNIQYEGTVGVLIEDNVIDIKRAWGIEFYSDRNSIIRHNAAVWRADSNCTYTGQQCGQISLDHKTADPAGSGNARLCQRRDGGQPQSCFGRLGRSQRLRADRESCRSVDRLVWVRVDRSEGHRVRWAERGYPRGRQPGPTPTPSTTPTPDTAADALWTPPRGARVGVTVTLDGTRSTGDGPISCTWSFEDQNGTAAFETLTGCTLKKAFKVTGAKWSSSPSATTTATATPTPASSPSRSPPDRATSDTQVPGPANPSRPLVGVPEDEIRTSSPHRAGTTRRNGVQEPHDDELQGHPVIPVALAIVMVAWLIVAAVVAGLCASAAAGDRALLQTLPRAQHVTDRAQQQLEVQPERPVRDVEVVDPDHLLHRHARPEDLPRPGHARA